MPKTHDVVAITGEYEKDGQTKPRYQNVGMVIEKDGKQYLKINSPIVLHDDGHVVNFFSLFEPRQKQQSTPQQSAPSPDDHMGPDDDIPW